MLIAPSGGCCTLIADSDAIAAGSGSFRVPAAAAADAVATARRKPPISGAGRGGCGAVPTDPAGACCSTAELEIRMAPAALHDAGCRMEHWIQTRFSVPSTLELQAEIGHVMLPEEDSHDEADDRAKRVRVAIRIACSRACTHHDDPVAHLESCDARSRQAQHTCGSLGAERSAGCPSPPAATADSGTPPAPAAASGYGGADSVA